MNAPAVLFDVDGTLVDSNYLHVYAWQRAFSDEGVPVAAWQVHRCIGMDGSKLVSTLSGDAPDDVQDRLSDAHSSYYRDLTSLLKPLPGIVEVALDRAGVPADQAVFVGDAVWDAHAAGAAGVQCIGVLSGGISEAELRAAGASPVFSDTRDLLDQLDCTPITGLAVSP